MTTANINVRVDENLKKGAEGSRDDALLHGVEFQGDRRTDRGKHQYRAGTHALCADQSAEADRRKAADPELIGQYFPEAVVI